MTNHQNCQVDSQISRMFFNHIQPNVIVLSGLFFVNVGNNINHSVNLKE
jgi:hypothetical protein